MTTDPARGLIGSLLHGLEIRTIKDLAELERHLAHVRERGYAVDRQELEPHLCCTLAASISVSGPDSRIDDASIPAIADAVRRAAAGALAPVVSGRRPARARRRNCGPARRAGC